MNSFFNPIPDFLEESEKQIEEIKNLLPRFLSDFSEGVSVAFEDNSDFFRAIHSISGGSSFAGLKEIETISWSLEKIVTNIFSGKVEYSKEVEDVMIKTIDVLEQAVKNKGKVKKKDIADLEKIFDRVLSEIQKEEKKKIKHLVKNTKEIKKPLEKEPPVKQSAIPEEEEHFSVVVSDSSKTEEDEFEEPVNQYVSFRIGVEHYAVSINYVYDMKEMLPCSRIPKQPPHYLGVANLRGNIVPVIDFRSFLGVKNPQFNEYTVFLMLKIGEKVKGCVVDAINDVVVLEPENTHVTPSVSRKTNLEYVTFIAKDPKTGQFLIVLDVEKILKDD